MPRPDLPLLARRNAREGSGLSRRAFLAASLVQAAAWLAACAVPPQPALPPAATTPPGTAPASPMPPGNTPTSGAAPSPTLSPSVAPLHSSSASLGSCAPAPVVAPTPLPYPGYTAQEPETGLHVTGPAQVIDLATYRLRVSGKVDRPLELAYDEIRCLPRVSAPVTLECPGFFIDHSNLAGTTIASVLALAAPQAGAARVRVLSSQDYSMPFALEEALDPQNFLAYEWEEHLLPASHGFPLRAAMPGRPGSSWVKWVVGIEVT